MSYKITVHVPYGKPLTFNNVSEYQLKENMCLFVDSFRSVSKAFPTSWCEITEVAE